MTAIPNLNNEQKRDFQRLREESIADGFQRWMHVEDPQGKRWLMPVLGIKDLPVEVTITINAGVFRGGFDMLEGRA